MPTLSGQAFLVGAGPGDPGLLTLRAVQCLETADVVLYDGLANTVVLNYARRAECICVGKHGKLPFWSQTAINDILVEKVKSGLRVVRLKGGDPAVFARTAEELAALEKHGLKFEVVPGVTAALAAASYTGIPLTHRDHASAVAFVTGKQQQGSDPQQFDWDGLAAFPGTLVFYMGVTTAPWWTKQLISAGKIPETPAAIVRRSTWRDQKIVRCRLDQVADTLTPASKMRPPVIVVVGGVANIGQAWDWFSQRPLSGVGVLLTRPDGSSELANLLNENGAETFQQSFLEPEFSQTDEQIEAIDLLARGKFQGVTFSSRLGAKGLMRAVQAADLDNRIFAGSAVAAVGPGTAQTLRECGLRADVVPDANYSAETLGKLLQPLAAGKHWLVTRTQASSNTLPNLLRDNGGEVTECHTYQMCPAGELAPEIQDAIDNGRIQFATITSPRLAREAVRLLASHISEIKPIALSESIAAELERLGWPAVAIAEQTTMPALARAIQLAANGEA